MSVETTFAEGRAPFRLGKKAALQDRRTLSVSNYLVKLPAAPPMYDGTFGITTWGMYANDHLGDCTCAGLAHMLMAWGSEARMPVQFTDDQVIELYNRVNGGHDDGAVELFVLREARKNGIAGHNLHAYAKVNAQDLEQVKAAAVLFSGLYLGVGLPITAQGQAIWDDTGDNDPRSQAWSWGGHAINAVGYDPDGPSIVTWGAVKKMTWKFWSRYVDEAWALIPEGFASQFFDVAKLESDLQTVSQVNP